MTDFVGLTWDHPRGRDALEAAAARFSTEGSDTLRWDVQPLEGFESSPIAELAQRYDLLVLDHPHLGDALATDSIRPLDELFAPAELERWTAQAVGPSAASYTVDGREWALPLDAATQVSARRPDLVGDAPASWADALRLGDTGLVAPSIAGPHAFLTLCSIAVSLGEEPALGAENLLSRPVAREALDILSQLAAAAPAGVLGLNPIGMLDRMSAGDDLGYIPLIYGYVNYSSPRRATPVAFAAPPTANRRIGSTIGGTGVAVTRRTEPTPALLDHLRWLLSPETQSRFIPEHAGQPSARSAWLDPAVDDAAGGFYSDTLTTIDSSWVRPRFAGYIPFQSHASAILRAGLTSNPEKALDELDAAYRAASSNRKAPA
jgi:multiple sugar transport system substrate-binding protein